MDAKEHLGKEGTAEVGLAVNRARRSTIDKYGRQAAFERLKGLKGTKRKYEITEVKNVYDEVQEDVYAKKRQDRMEADWIIDDDGSGYVEDGREIFDEEEDDNIFVSKKSKKRMPKECKKPIGANIKSMFANMPTKKRKIDTTMKLEDDEALKDVLQDLNIMGGNDIIFDKVMEDGKEIEKPIITVKKGITKEKAVTEVKKDVKNEKVIIEPEKEQDEGKIIIEFKNEEKIDASILDVKKEEEMENVIEEKTMVSNRGFLTEHIKAVHTFESSWEKTNTSCEAIVTDIHIDSSKLPVVTNDIGDQVLRFFWFDAFEDYFNHPGTIYLFGKVWIETAQKYVSCCVLTKNIQRRLYLLPRLKRINLKTREEMGDVTMLDVYEEFNQTFAKKNKILEFKCRQVTKKYAFDKYEVPNEADYFEMRYSADYPSPKQDLVGETFSHCFGSNTSSLELFLLDRKIKGPCWLDVKSATVNSPSISWCKVEACIFNANDITAVVGIAAPPVVVMTINMKTKINLKTHQSEIVLVSSLIHNEFHLDKTAPHPQFQSHFCALTQPPGANWPWDFKSRLQSYNGTKVEKCDSERVLLGYFLAKIQMIDPDVIIGYDILGFDIGVLLHRIQANKIPQWSKIGRLKRIHMPKMSSRGFSEKIAMSGRLICDIKISAKELIQAKSYELGPLICKVLKVSEHNRVELASEKILQMFEDSNSIIRMINSTMQDASYILRIATELNVLPLALQITNIAGNVMSRTLLGGRSERNEFLLLHAFNEKGFICPDKLYGKAQTLKNDVEDQEDVKGGKRGRKKASYSGGLVLEPKKGFYDTFILLMDFNSLYPSIIQEYNICFTTMNRSILQNNGTDTEETQYDMPDSELAAGVLPIEIRKLVQSRREVKNLMKLDISPELKQQYDIRQKALKLTANSMYGCLGFSHSRFYAKHLASLVTAKGREILLRTRDMVHKMNFDVIYGDTDSIMINTNCKDFDEVFKLGYKIKKEVNKQYDKLELDVDGVFKYMLLLKKKKYAAVTMTKLPDGTVLKEKEYKGLDIVRRDWCQLSSDLGRNILDQILSDQGPDQRIEHIHNILEKAKNDLEAAKIRLDFLTITKQLTKNPEDYPDKKNLAHVQVALRYNSSGDKKLRQGDTVPYVICDDGSNLSATQRAYHVDEVKRNDNLKVDHQYYLAQQIHPVISRLCDHIEGTDAARIAEILGLDASHYRQRRQNDDNELTSVEISDEEKYRLCERFSFTCRKCQILVTLDTPTKGSGSSVVFALESCPNPKCDDSPKNNSIYLVNKLRRDVKKYVSRYYAGWLVCEDPSCNRTRRMPIRFSKGLPICTTCKKSVLYKEYSETQLYKQLCFFDHVFDFDKECSKNRELRIRSEGLNKFYHALHYEVNSHLKLNSFSAINLNDIFSCIYIKK